MFKQEGGQATACCSDSYDVARLHLQLTLLKAATTVTNITAYRLKCAEHLKK
jgi:hypothetical protein